MNTNFRLDTQFGDAINRILASKHDDSTIMLTKEGTLDHRGWWRSLGTAKESYIKSTNAFIEALVKCKFEGFNTSDPSTELAMYKFQAKLMAEFKGVLEGNKPLTVRDVKNFLAGSVINGENSFKSIFSNCIVLDSNDLGNASILKLPGNEQKKIYEINTLVQNLPKEDIKEISDKLDSVTKVFDSKNSSKPIKELQDLRTKIQNEFLNTVCDKIILNPTHAKELMLSWLNSCQYAEEKALFGNKDFCDVEAVSNIVHEQFDNLTSDFTLTHEQTAKRLAILHALKESIEKNEISQNLFPELNKTDQMPFFQYFSLMIDALFAATDKLSSMPNETANSLMARAAKKCGLSTMVEENTTLTSLYVSLQKKINDELDDYLINTCKVYDTVKNDDYLRLRKNLNGRIDGFIFDTKLNGAVLSKTIKIAIQSACHGRLDEFPEEKRDTIATTRLLKDPVSEADFNRTTLFMKAEDVSEEKLPKPSELLGRVIHDFVRRSSQAQGEITKTADALIKADSQLVESKSLKIGVGKNSYSLHSSMKKEADKLTSDNTNIGNEDLARPVITNVYNDILKISKNEKQASSILYLLTQSNDSILNMALAVAPSYEISVNSQSDGNVSLAITSKAEDYPCVFNAGFLVNEQGDIAMKSLYAKPDNTGETAKNTSETFKSAVIDLASDPKLTSEQKTKRFAILDALNDCTFDQNYQHFDRVIIDALWAATDNLQYGADETPASLLAGAARKCGLNVNEGPESAIDNLKKSLLEIIKNEMHEYIVNACKVSEDDYSTDIEGIVENALESYIITACDLYKPNGADLSKAIKILLAHPLSQPQFLSNIEEHGTAQPVLNEKISIDDFHMTKHFIPGKDFCKTQNIPSTKDTASRTLSVDIHRTPTDETNTFKYKIENDIYSVDKLSIVAANSKGKDEAKTIADNIWEKLSGNKNITDIQAGTAMLLMTQNQYIWLNLSLANNIPCDIAVHSRDDDMLAVSYVSKEDSPKKCEITFLVNKEGEIAMEKIDINS